MAQKIYTTLKPKGRACWTLTFFFHHVPSFLLEKIGLELRANRTEAALIPHTKSKRNHLRVWHVGGDSVELAAQCAAAGVARKANSIKVVQSRRLLHELPLHTFTVLLLELRALFDPALCGTERPVLEFADQLWVEGDLLGSDGVQVANAVHVSLGGGHVQRRVVVIVQTPHVGTESHQEGQAVVVAIGSCQVKRRVPPYVTLVRVSSVGHKKDVRCNLYNLYQIT